MNRLLSKFKVLTWKNLLLKRRHLFMTSLEVVVPILLFVLLAFLRYEMSWHKHFIVKLCVHFVSVCLKGVHFVSVCLKVQKWTPTETKLPKLKFGVK